MKQQLQKQLLPLAVTFLLTGLIWLIFSVPWFNYIYLLFGLLWGAFFLELDHLIFWLYLEPGLDESKQAQQYLKQKQYGRLVSLWLNKRHHHTSLIFHHYFFQTVFSLISIFIATSSQSVFAAAFVFAINFQIIKKQIIDYRHNPKKLQLWLFARESKQIPAEYLKFYLLIFSLLTLIILLGLVTLP